MLILCFNFNCVNIKSTNADVNGVAYNVIFTESF